jgi:hypothetical protein
VANRGKLIVDATCAPADIRYPTDASLLNDAREKTDALIDALHEPLVGQQPRPRTYRPKARRQFVVFVKQKKPNHNKIRRANRQQLGYLKRNLRALDRLLVHPEALPLAELSRRQYKDLLVCRELYRQQQQMYDQRCQRIDDRIVSIYQPHVRPIKRGKAGRDTEFGGKLSLQRGRRLFLRRSLELGQLQRVAGPGRADRTIQASLRLLSRERARRQNLSYA